MIFLHLAPNPLYLHKKYYDTRSQKEFEDEQDDARSIMRECGYGTD